MLKCKSNNKTQCKLIKRERERRRETKLEQRIQRVRSLYTNNITFLL